MTDRTATIETGGEAALPVWPQDAEAICEKIRNNLAPFKVVLKLKDEHILLPMWLDHYLSFLKPHEIIIADNGSTDPRVLDLYKALDRGITIFCYAGDPKNGFHNNIHSRQQFPALYSAISDSSDHHIFVDSDEFIIYATSKYWTKDRCILLEKISQNSGKAMASAWLETVQESENIVYIGVDDSRINNSLAWGKPIVPAHLSQPGFPIHNGQFPESAFSIPGEGLFILLHLKNYSREQRLSVSRQKLIARGLINRDASFEEIAALDVTNFNDPTATRIVWEVAEILSKPSGGRNRDMPRHSIKFDAAGQITFSDTAARDLVEHTFSDLANAQKAGFSIAHRILGVVK